jgi:hypothetical protein
MFVSMFDSSSGRKQIRADDVGAAGAFCLVERGDLLVRVKRFEVGQQCSLRRVEIAAHSAPVLVFQALDRRDSRYRERGLLHVLLHSPGPCV